MSLNEETQRSPAIRFCWYTQGRIDAAFGEGFDGCKAKTLRERIEWEQGWIQQTALKRLSAVFPQRRKATVMQLGIVPSDRRMPEQI